jgi:uncharacterized protein with PIN domain
MVDLETVKLLGAALGSIKTITDIAGTITNTQLRQELNSKIADLQTAILTARQKMLEMQGQYEQVLQENKQLKAQLAETVEAEPCPRCRRKGWRVQSSEPDAMFGELGAVRRLYECDFCRFSESPLMTAKR